ncbi:MAG: quinolinate synthase NadA [Bacillota bacterium]|nr:quinolinate synthase NadA [Bacillota bacterium]
MDNKELKDKVLELKEKHNAVIVAHNYQVDEVQEIADIVGDSFALSKYCSTVSCKTIVFCGVHFMAESAKILSPEKTVLLPEIDAGCPMADMVTADGLIEMKKRFPEAVVVCYINSSAEVKAESDVCCTSSNAVEIVKKIEQKNIIFAPDQNLASFVAKQVPDKNIIPWKGFCITHHKIKAEDVVKIKELHSDSFLLVHPECKPEIVEMANFAGSTKQIIDFATKSKNEKFIIGTEMGVLYKLKKNNPNKTFYMMSQGLICPNMKKTSLASIYNSLNELKYEINLDEEVRVKAKRSLDKMLELSS